jgi:hypothetical protein
MTFTEKVLFVVAAVLLASIIAIAAIHTIAVPWSYVLGSATGLVVGYYCDKLWRRWNK